MLNTTVSTNIDWKALPARRDLSTRTIALWRVKLDNAPRGIQEMRDLVSHDEAERSRKFRFEADRRRFIISRATLRLVLGYYLGVEPSLVGFCTGPYGKPSISASGSDVRFNVSRSRDLALIAVSRGCEIGVDVEYVRPVPGYESISEQFLAPSEISTLRSLRPFAREAAFLNCWTRKEAYLKARGEGLSFELNRFEVSLAPGEPAVLLRVHGEPAEPGRWTIVDLPLGPGYIGALAAERGEWRLDFHEWPD